LGSHGLPLPLPLPLLVMGCMVLLMGETWMEWFNKGVELEVYSINSEKEDFGNLVLAFF
jgi:hypothetical protein